MEAALLGYHMARRGDSFQAGEGLIKGDIEQTIRAFGHLAKQGMHGTDKTILQIMLEA